MRVNFIARFLDSQSIRAIIYMSDVERIRQDLGKPRDQSSTVPGLFLPLILPLRRSASFCLVLIHSHNCC